MTKQYDITIQYIDEIRCKVLTRREILISLKDEYSFYPEGYKFTPAYKQGRWNGQISMIDGKGIFYNGLIKDLIKKCIEKGLTVKVENPEKYFPVKIENSVIDKLASYCNLTPYDYQYRSVKEALSKKKLLILSPTSSGKSNILYMLYRHCIDNNINMLITVPSTSLVEQLYSDFESYVKDDHIVEDHVARLYSGQDKSTKKPVIISTWQTCTNMPKEWFERFGFYACDEAHGSSAKELSSIIDNLNKCEYRIGLTGTLNGSEIHELEMHARFGQIFKMVSTRELIDRGIITNINIEMLRLTRTKEEVTRFWKACGNDYQKEIDYLIGSSYRNNMITDMALTLPNTSLLLFNKIEGHGVRLLELLNEKRLVNKKQIFYIAGSVKVKDREIIRKTLDGALPLFNDIKLSNGTIITVDNETHNINTINKYVGKSFPLEEYDESDYGIQGLYDSSATVLSIESCEGAYILLGTYGTLAVGINVKNLHNLIFCHPFKGKIRILQSIGRLLRKSKSKNIVNLYDIIDDYRNGRRVNHVYKHAETRLEMYEQEEFEYEIIERKV